MTIQCPARKSSSARALLVNAPGGWRSRCCLPAAIGFRLINVKGPGPICYAGGVRLQTFTDVTLNAVISRTLNPAPTGVIFEGVDTYGVYPVLVGTVSTLGSSLLIACDFGAVDCVPFGGGCAVRRMVVQFFLATTLDRFWLTVDVNVEPSPMQVAGPFAVALPVDYLTANKAAGVTVLAAMPFGGEVEVTL